MKKVIFKKSPQTSYPPLYIARNLKDQKNSGWCAYLYRSDVRNPEPNLTLNQTWIHNGGIYLFAPHEPQRHEDFVQKVNKFLASIQSSSFMKSIIMWIDNPDIKEFSRENVWFIKINRETETGYFVTSEDLNILFGDYISFAIPKGSLVKYDDAAQHFRIHRYDSQGSRIIFSGTESQTDTEVIDNEIFLPFYGVSRGTIRFRMLAYEKHENDFYSNFKVGMRYFYTNKEKISMVDYPLFQPSETRKFTFQVALDPVNQWNQDSGLRTYLAFELHNPNLSSYYRTQFGNEIQLAPAVRYKKKKVDFPYQDPEANCAMFVFSPQRKNEVSKKSPMYMLPQGDFHIRVPKVKMPKGESADLVPIQILCGLSGTETIACSLSKSAQYSGDVLSFQTGQAAYSPIFKYTDKNTKEKCVKAINDELLNDEFLTAWVAVKAAEGEERPIILGEPDLDIRYLAQPEDESFFRPIDNNKVLDFYQSTVASMTNKPNYVPLVPHSGVILDSKTGSKEVDFELEIIYATRKKKMDQLFYFQVLEQKCQNKSQEVTEPIKATTPQGLLLTQEGSNWTELLLAQNNKSPESTEKVSLRFECLEPVLRNAFQTDQQFLVISLNKGGNLEGFKNEISIAGWPFKIDIPTERSEAGDYKNILIFKYCQGTLFEKIKNPTSWTNPQHFNDSEPGGVDDLSIWLKDYCLEAIRKENENKNFSHFSNIIQNPDWNGILALKVNLSLANFPKELKCLLGGMEMDKLHAHHIGINVNRVKSGKLGLEIDGVSSMFGLINYNDEEFKESAMDKYKYKFKVSKLEVLFENSKLVKFYSAINLTMNWLFGSWVENKVKNSHDENSDNVITFEGTYEDHNGVTSYVFNAIDTKNSVLVNKILRSFGISKATFRTIDEDKQNNKIYTRFSFWGGLDFAKSEDKPDVFSYGSNDEIGFEESEQREGLTISNLGLLMNFDLNLDSNITSELEFKFDPTEVSFDLSQSIPRKNSLIAGFPLQLSRFIYGKGTEQLKGEGYLPITIDGVGELKKILPEEEWFGFDYSLDLGSKGDLSSNNSMVSSIVLCWSGSSSIFLGLKIPGISQQSTMFKLQEIIDNNFENENEKVRLVYDGAFGLILKDVSQLFMGKKVLPEGLDIALFKSPEGVSSSSLGWYAAYNKRGEQCEK